MLYLGLVAIGLIVGVFPHTLVPCGFGSLRDGSKTLVFLRDGRILGQVPSIGGGDVHEACNIPLISETSPRTSVVKDPGNSVRSSLPDRSSCVCITKAW